MCPSVGVAGGYPSAGGHSPIGPSFGLAADNVLQFEVVTADGVLHTVNQCREPDLFFALRGGGSGTFGVTTAVTYKLNLQPAAWTSFLLNFVPSPAGSLFNATQMKNIFRAYARQAAQMDANRWGARGYFEINAAVGFAGTFLIPQDIERANKSITALNVLSRAYPTAGAYFSESYAEKDFRNTYWGNKNYAKLLQIKKKYDPKGFFTCIQCVGSEDWSKDGNYPASVTDTSSADNTDI